MSIISNLDAFVKPRSDLQSRSALGGIITLVAIITTTILVLAEMYVYFGGVTHHTLHLTTSITSRQLPIVAQGEGGKVPVASNRGLWSFIFGKVPVDAYITFPHAPCSMIDITIDGGTYSHNKGTIQSAHGVKQKVSMQYPNHFETMAIHGGRGASSGSGCTIKAELSVPKTAGDISVTVKRELWKQAVAGIKNPNITSATNNIIKNGGFNMSYYIHHVRFQSKGLSTKALATSSSSQQPYLIQDPLEKRFESFQTEHGGVALKKINIQLIPISFQNWLGSRRREMYSDYQRSVSEHTVNLDTLIQTKSLNPGLVLSYDFSPLAVKQVERRDNMFVFLGNLIGIIGGVFVTVRLVVGCLLNTAASAVSKKRD